MSALTVGSTEYLFPWSSVQDLVSGVYVVGGWEGTEVEPQTLISFPGKVGLFWIFL